MLASENLAGSMGGEMYNPYKNYTWATVIDPATGLLMADANSMWNESWMDELTNKKAVRKEYQLGVSGGDRKTKYAFSVGLLDDNGVLITTNFKRYSLRANVDHQVNDWLAAGASASYAYTTQNSSQYSNTRSVSMRSSLPRFRRKTATTISSAGILHSETWFPVTLRPAPPRSAAMPDSA